MSKRRNLLKTLPGILVSIFFLWYTFRGISFRQILSLRFAQPLWIAGILVFTTASYTLRCVRWTLMMRGTGARFKVCARVLMTSLAANNILPLRIGDIMRVFTYSDDLGASPSVILSTVILEKLLDIFILVLLFAATMGSISTPHLRLVVLISLGVTGCGLLVLLLGVRVLQPRVTSMFRLLPQSAKAAKLEHWIELAMEAMARLGLPGSLLLLMESALIWTCEGMIFVSGALLFGITTDRIGPWLAVSFANLSYLLPSSPGAIGPFELAVKTALTSHGAPLSQAALFGLALHAWLLVSITGSGGFMFLFHRFREQTRTPLLEEIDALPEDLP